MKATWWIGLINGSIVIVVAIIFFVAIELRKRFKFVAEKKALINQICWLIKDRKINEALQLLNESNLDLRSLRPKTRAYILFNYGKCFFDIAEINPATKIANLKSAIQYYNLALKCYPVGHYLLEKAMILNELGRCFNNLAELEEKTNNFETAKSCLQNALSLISNKSRNGLLAKIKYNLGITYYNLANLNHDNEHHNLLLESIALLTNAAKIFFQKKKYYEYALAELALSISYRKYARHINQYDNLLKGLEAVNQALVYLERKQDALKFAQAQYNLGSFHLLLAKYEATRQHLVKAFRAFKKAAQIYTITNNPFEYANINYKLMKLFLEAQKEFNNKKYFYKAIESSHQALKVFTIDRYPFSYASINHQLGHIYSKLAEYDNPEFNLKRATEVFEEALRTRVYTNKTEPQVYSEIKMSLGKTYLTLFKYVTEKETLSNAIDALETAITANNFSTDQETAEAHQLLGKAYTHLATIEEPKTNLKTALESYEQAAELFELNLNPVGYAILKMETGLVLKELAIIQPNNTSKLLAQAIAAFNDSLSILSENNYPEEIAQIHKNLGDIYYQMAQISNPENNLTKALKAYDTALILNKDPQLSASVNFNKGLIYKQFAQLKDALTNFNKALQAFQNVVTIYSNEANISNPAMIEHKNLELASAHEQIGDVYLEIAQIEEKEFNITKAKRAYDKAIVYLTDDSKQSAGIYFKLGKTLQSLAAFGNGAQNITEAIQFFEKALTLYNKESEPFEYALILNHLGVAYQHLTEYSLKHKEINLLNSTQSLQEALTVFNIQKYPFEYAMTQNNLGTAYGMLAEIKDRNENLLLAMRAFDEALKVYSSQTHPDDYRKVIANQDKIKSRFRLHTPAKMKSN